MDNPLDVYTGFDNDPNKLAWTSNYERDCFIVCWWDADFDDTYEHSIIRINTQTGVYFDPNGPNWCYLPFIGWLRCGYNGFSNLSALDQQDAITHELGHTIGLAHAGYYAGEKPGSGFPDGTYSVMDYCCPGFATPRAHDINDLNAKYPGW